MIAHKKKPTTDKVVGPHQPQMELAGVEPATSAVQRRRSPVEPQPPGQTVKLYHTRSIHATTDKFFVA
jgi:hypothetical protein